MDTVTVPPFDELEDRILPWSQVKIICGLSRTTVWRMSKTGDFPACVQVSQNRVGWWQSELLAWKRARTPRRLPEPRVVLAALKCGSAWKRDPVSGVIGVE
ncbi:helix-turn-helix transcriptional regulator [Brevundimonas mediterranea]|jgi:predicted DNA-binding transcriptional regulator AlpA